jgi:transcriptional regulator with XRE-family HTH domain
MPAVDETRVRTGMLLLGARVRQERKRAGLGLPELAELSGVSQAFLSYLERGQRLPSLPVLDTLAAALGTSVVALLQGVYPWGDPEPPAQAPQPAPDGRAGRSIPGRRGQPED